MESNPYIIYVLKVEDRIEQLSDDYKRLALYAKSYLDISASWKIEKIKVEDILQTLGNCWIKGIKRSFADTPMPIIKAWEQGYMDTIGEIKAIQSEVVEDYHDRIERLRGIRDCLDVHLGKILSASMESRRTTNASL